MRQLGFSASPTYLRRRAVGHDVDCGCEECFVFIERAIQRYLPGLLPPDPVAHRLRELEMANAELLAQNERLLRAMRATGFHSTPPREPQRQERPGAAFEPVVISE